jgi:hypothetical protein
MDISQLELSTVANRAMRSPNTDYPHEGRIGPEKHRRLWEPPWLPDQLHGTRFQSP